MSRSAILLILVCAARSPAGFPEPRSREVANPDPSIQIHRLQYDLPRPLRAWAVRVDLREPGVELVVTPKVKAPDGFEALSATTLEFAEREKTHVAINGGPFEPLRAKSGEPMRINGLHLSRGELISPANDRGDFAALLVSGSNQPVIRPYPITAEDQRAARNGMGGFQIVVAAGVNRLAGTGPPDPPRHPRTAVGTSDRGRFLWLLVVDGRQPGTSEGLTYAELGDWALSLGLTELLNLDGGGSTTLVMDDPATRSAQVINTPVGKGVPGTLRQVGNNLGVRIYNRPGDLTAAQLMAVMPRLPAERVPVFLGPLNRVMAERDISTTARRAAFLAQLAHESGELKFMEEIASGEAYEGRKSLGNTEPGDGRRYKGRGPIQLTGRANYRRAGAVLGLDLEGEPDRAADPEVGCRVAGWFWQSHGLNQLADVGDFRQITRRINGGFNGLAMRETYWARAKEVLMKAESGGANAVPD